MSYQALYRKWRPETFDRVVGQDAVMTTLKNQVSAGRVGHAYLFCGTRGTGKTSAAKIMARAVNCPHSSEHDGNPCNECEICEGIKRGTSMNVFEIDAASNNGVDNIRDIRDEVEYPPVTGKYKVYIIDEVHMLSTGAFNALLKTLEEPPAYVIFILATTDPQKLPATILSRCQRYDFRRMSRRTAAEHLREIADSEGMDAEDRALTYIAEAADGSMRDALSLLDQCMAYHYHDRLSYEDVLKIIGASDPSVYSRLYRKITDGDSEGALETVNDIIESGADIIQLTNDFIWYLRNVLLSGSVREGAEDILDISEERLKMAKADAGLADKKELVMMLGSLSELTNRMRFSSQKRVLLEVEILRLSARRLMSGGSASRATVNASYAKPVSDRSKGSQPVSEYTGVQRYSHADVGRKNNSAAAVSNPVEEITARDQNLGAKSDEEGLSISEEKDAVLEETGEAERTVPLSSNPGILQETSGDSDIDIIKAHWSELVEKLIPSNRPLFAGALLKEEHGNIVVIFKNSVSFKMAAKNVDENGILRLRDLVLEITGRPVKLMARVANPGEIKAMEDRATDEQLARINFHIDIEG